MRDNTKDSKMKHKSLAGRVSVGHPVDIGSGEMYTAWHDVEIWGEVPLVFRRFYSTTLASMGRKSIFGVGWTHNFEKVLQYKEGTFLFIGHDGADIYFDITEQELRNGKECINAGAFMQLRIEHSKYVVSHWHGWQSEVQKFVFQKLGENKFICKFIQQPSGMGIELFYDNYNRLEYVMQSIEQRKLHIIYNAQGQCSGLQLSSPISNPRELVKYKYDAKQRLVEILDALSAPMLYRYNKRNFVESETTRSGAVFYFKYDDKGRCVETKGENHYHYRRLKYDNWGFSTEVEDSTGSKTLYRLNERGQVVLKILPNGAQYEKEYDQIGRVVKMTGPLGDETSYHYDERGDLVKTEYANGMSVEVKYNEHHQPVEVSQEKALWQLNYNYGAIVSITDPCGGTTSFKRDNNRMIREIYEPSGNILRIDQSKDLSRIRYSDGIGLDQEEIYDDALNLAMLIEPDGSIYRYESDALGRLVSIILPDGATKTINYNNAGYVTSITDELKKITVFEYDKYGHCTKIVNAMGETHAYVWDTEGRLIKITNPKSECTRIVYDKNGNVIKVEYFDGRVEEFAYDIAGRPIQKKTADGSELLYEYDMVGNIINCRHGEQTLASYKYDKLGQILNVETEHSTLKVEYDLLGRMISEEQNNEKIEYEYNVWGGISKRFFSKSSLDHLFFKYDSRKRLESVSVNNNIVESYRYDAKDLVSERLFGDIVEKFQYDNKQQLIGQSIIHRGLELLSREYKYDLKGNLAVINDSKRGMTQFKFDSADRLINEQRDTMLHQYVYDANGNLTNHSTGAVGEDLSYQSGDVLVQVNGTTVHRDTNQFPINITNRDRELSLEWNVLGQLVSITDENGNATNYKYDGLGRRIEKSSGDSFTYYYWAGNQLIAEVSNDSVKEYLFSEFKPMVVWTNGQSNHVIDSGTGQPAEVINRSGEIMWEGHFDAFGNTVSIKGKQSLLNMRFPGQYFDTESGLNYNRFRYYWPQTGQYISPDPLGFFGGANVYRYTHNPIHWADPLGLSCNIPPGQHSVYVLEAGNPPRIVYVGITRQSPHARLAQHRANPPGGVPFTRMRVVASGPPTVANRRAARNIEGSALHHASQGNLQGASLPLRNSGRPVNSGYYHQYDPASPGATTTSAGHPIMNQTSTNSALSNNVVTIT